MSKKYEPSEVEAEVESVSGRRDALKKAVGGAAIPLAWSTPVLNTVLTPAHAQTSAPTITAGVYQSLSPLSFNARDVNSTPSTEYALLDMLIAPANASHIVDEICPGRDEPRTALVPDDAGDDYDDFNDDVVDDGGQGDQGNSELFVRVNEDMTVDFAVTSLGEEVGFSACGLAGSVSVIDGTSIPDVAIQLDDDEFVYLRGMEVSGVGQISGMYSVDIDDQVICSGMFTLQIGGVFPEGVGECRDD